MSVLDKLHPRKHGAMSHVVEAGEYSAASWVYGYTQTKYREKASVKGVPLDLAAGAGLTVLGLLGDLWTGGSVGGGLLKRVARRATPHVGVLGKAGLGAYFHTWGSGVGAEGAGVRRLLVKDSDVEAVKKALGGRVTMLGEIPKAPKPGAFLSAKELARMAG